MNALAAVPRRPSRVLVYDRRHVHLGLSSFRYSWRVSPEDSVVNADHQTWQVPNLFVCDGSVMPMQGAANRALTITVLASRLAERLIDKQVATTERALGSAK